MIKDYGNKDNLADRFYTNEQLIAKCELCEGDRYLRFPDFRQIHEYDLWTSIHNGGNIPVTNCACHICRPQGIDLDDRVVRTYRKAFDAWASKGAEYINCIILAARRDCIVHFGYYGQERLLRLYDIPQLLSDDYDTDWIEQYKPVQRHNNVNQIVGETAYKMRMETA